MKVFRKGKEEDVKIKLGEQPDQLANASNGGKSNESGESEGSATTTLGVELRDLSDQMAQQFGYEKDVKGAVVFKVKPGSPAARKLRIGDVITDVGDETVSNAKEAREALKNADLSKGVRLTVMGPEGSRFVFLKSK
jgi:serine protease Do